MASPIEQFEIKPIIPAISFTNSSLFMIGAAAVIVGGLLYATRKRALVPGRAQSVAEVLHDFVAGTLRDAAGQEGMKFFPLVFSLFMFVLTANLLGMIPGFFTVTSHIIVTFALAILVIGTVVVYGFIAARHAFPRAFRALGRADLAPSLHRRDRIDLVPVAADLAEPSTLRQHARRAYRPQGLRRLRRKSSRLQAARSRSSLRCRSSWRSPSWRSNSSSPACRPTSSRC